MQDLASSSSRHGENHRGNLDSIDSSSSPDTSSTSPSIELPSLDSPSVAELDSGLTRWESSFPYLSFFCRLCLVHPRQSATIARLWVCIICGLGLAQGLSIIGFSLYQSQDPFFVLYVISLVGVTFQAPLACYVSWQYLKSVDFSKLLSAYFSRVSPVEHEHEKQIARHRFYSLIAMLVAAYVLSILSIVEQVDKSLIWVQIINNICGFYIFLLCGVFDLVVQAVSFYLSHHLERVGRSDFRDPDEMLDNHFSLVEMVKTTFRPIGYFVGYTFSSILFLAIFLALYLYRSYFFISQQRNMIIVWLNLASIVLSYCLPTVVMMVRVAKINNVTDVTLDSLNRQRMFGYQDRILLRSELESVPIVVPMYGDGVLSRALPAVTYSSLSKLLLSLLVSLVPVVIKFVLIQK